MGGGPLPSDAGRAERMYKVRRAMGHMFFQAATLTGAGTGDAELFHVVCGGDPARTAVWLTSSLSAGAVIEVFLFQIVGRATDHTGRKKPWLFLSPGMSFVTGLAPFLCPRLPVVWASRLLTSSFSALFGGTNMTSAMLSDVVQGDELAQAFSLLVAVMGAGLFIGTQTGSFLHRYFGDPRYAHLGRSVFAALGFLHNLSIPETLPLAERKHVPLRLADANPLGFTRLLTRSRAISTLAIATTLCHCTEGKVTADLKALWIRDVGLSLPAQGHFLSYSLALGAFGGSIGAKLIPAIGRRGFTTVACVCSAIGHFLVSNPHSRFQWLGFLAQGPGINANNGSAMKAYCGQLAADSGMGRGEFQACMASMRSIVIATVPMLYGSLYGFQQSRGEVARWAWWAVALLGAVIPELLHRTLSDADLQQRGPAAAAGNSERELAQRAASSEVLKE